MLNTTSPWRALACAATILLVPGTAPASEPEPPTPASLEEAIALAESAHPALRAARLDEQAALARAEAADVLPDPRVTLGVFGQEVETRVGPQEATLSVSQTLPWFGKRALRREVALGEAEVRAARVESQRLSLREQVTRAWVELWLLERRVAIAEENVEVLKRFEEIVRTRYKVARADHPDLLRLQLEIGRVEDRLRQLEDMRPALAARLNELMARPLDAPLKVQRTIPGETLAAEAEPMLDESAASQPAVRALEAASRAAETRGELARRDAHPDLTFGLTYTSIGAAALPNVPGSGDDAWLATVSLNVPLWSRQRVATVQRALHERDALSERAAEHGRALAAEARQALYEHRDAERRVTLYRESLVPKVQESLRATVIAYSTGEADFLGLLDAERTLLELRLAEERARADLAISLARLDALAGKTLPREQEGDLS